MDQNILIKRGIKDTSHLSKINEKPGFLSTSLYLPSLQEFMKDEYCCILEIIIQPNTPCLFIATLSKEVGEFEMLCHDGCKLAILHEKDKEMIDAYDFDIISNIRNSTSNHDLEKKHIFEAVLFT